MPFFLKMILISLYWILQFLYPVKSLLGISPQFFITLFTYITLFDSLVLMWKLHLNNDFLNRTEYYFVNIFITLWYIGLPLLAVNRMYVVLETTKDINFFIVLIAPALLHFVGYGWILLTPLVKKPINFLTRYCMGIQIILLFLFIFTEVSINGINTTYLKMFYLYPVKYYWITLYIFTSIVVLVSYYISLINNLKGSKIAIVGSVLGFILNMPTVGSINNLFYYKIMLLLMLVSTLPNIYREMVLSNIK